MPKGEFEDTYKEFYKKKKQRFSVEDNDYAYFKTHYSNLSLSELSKILVVPRIDIDTSKLLSAYQSQNSFQYCIQLMSIPEYQLC